MPHYIRNGNMYTIREKAELNVQELLPVGTYVVGFHPEIGFYLDIVDAFELPSRIYGDTASVVQRILNTYQSRPQSTGVLLKGEKGSGKTLCSKMTSIVGAERGIPTIIVNSSLSGPSFNKFMQQIEQEVIVIFDEFEKVYDAEHQEELLTLFDGVFPTKKLFILTCNDGSRIDSHMQNRPGRIFYALEYAGLEVAFIREYCQINLKNQAHVESVCNISTLFWRFNFDILKALVEEMNRYDETAVQALKFINAKPDSGNHTKYDLVLTVDGNEIGTDFFYPQNITGSPVGRAKLEIEQTLDTWVEVDGEQEQATVGHIFLPQHLSKINADEGSYTFVNGNVSLTCKRHVYESHSLANGYGSAAWD